MLKKLLSKIKNRLIRFTPPYDCFVYVGDLLSPYDGKLTAGQLIIVSRILDIESYNNGFSEFAWQQRFHEICNKDIDMSQKEIKELQNYFSNIINSLELNGFNPNMSRIQLIARQYTYLLPNNGTHRIAWLFCKKQYFIPSTIMQGNIWFSLCGEEYWHEKGLTSSEIEILLTKWQNLEKKLRHDLCCILNIKYITVIEDLVKPYGKLLESSVNLDLFQKIHDMKHSFLYVKKRLSTDSKYKIYSFIPNTQMLYYNTGVPRIRSHVVDNLSNIIDKSLGKNRWGYICHSLTESIEVESYFCHWLNAQ